jgi:hypothetical protein
VNWWLDMNIYPKTLAFLYWGLIKERMQNEIDRIRRGQH